MHHLLAACSAGALLPAADPASAAATAAASDHAGWGSILPPLIAIGLALTLRQVIAPLFIGLWVGAWAVYDFSAAGFGRGLLDTAERYLIDALSDPDHASVILFSLTVGGMTGVISRNGGLQGIVRAMLHLANSARRASVATVGLGFVIFFDDYANTLVVGNTMRSITDRMRVSREKLAYLVDSTAAPIACIALVTTWIGYEVGLIRSALEAMAGLELNAYHLFLSSIPYSFYPLFALVLVVAVAASGRDFGPMRAAEQRARRGEGVAPPTLASTLLDEEMRNAEPKQGIPHRAVNAVVPMAVLVCAVIGGMLASGEGENIQEIIGNADPFLALLWGSLLALVSAVVLTLAQRILTLAEVTAAWFAGLRSMLQAIVILVLAWALAGVTDQLGTAHFLSDLIGDRLHPGFMPSVVFVLAAATAFATGSSWGTMGILLPLMLPLTWALMAAQGLAEAEHLPLLYATVAAVLGGAVWGDHCSPISDTTILSSMASQCDHIEHVRTQLPYALFAGLAALLIGALPAGFGVPWWLCLPLGALCIVAGLRWLGRAEP